MTRLRRGSLLAVSISLSGAPSRSTASPTGGNDPTAPSTRRRECVDSQPMAPTNRPVITPRFSVAVLLAAVVATSLGIVAEFRAWSADGPGAVYSLATYAVIGVTAIYQLLRHRRIEAVAAMAALTFCALSLTDAGRSTGFDSGYTLACLILISVVYVATRESKSRGPPAPGRSVSPPPTPSPPSSSIGPRHRRLRPPHDRDPRAGAGHVDHLAADPVAGGRIRAPGQDGEDPEGPRHLLPGFAHRSG